MNIHHTTYNVLENEQVCYKLFYLLSHKHKYLLALGLVNRRTYRHLGQFTEARDGRIVGLKTIEGTRHGEWVIGMYATHYNNGTTEAWEEYITPVLGWCETSLWALKRTWRLGRFTLNGHLYGVNCWYDNCIIQSVDITIIGANIDTRRYDWCENCVNMLSFDSVCQYTTKFDIDAIENFLVNGPSAPYAHIKVAHMHDTV